MASIKNMLLVLFVGAVAAAPAVTTSKTSTTTPKTTSTTPKTTSTTTTNAGLFCLAVDNIVTAAGAQSAATTFCSSYLSIALATKFVTVTPTPMTTTVRTTIQATSAPSITTVITVQTVIPSAFITTSTLTQGMTTVTSTGSTCPVAAAAASIIQGRATTPSPKPAAFAAFVGAELSSACNCLHVPTSTSTVTSSVSVTTSTVVSLFTTTNAGLIQTRFASNIVTLAQQTSIVTATVQATSTSFALAPAPCGIINFPGAGGQYDNSGIDLVYSEYFSGCGVSLLPNSPADFQYIDYYPNAATACIAIEQCAADAAHLPDERSFYVYQVIGTPGYQCNLYDRENTDPNTFVSDPTVGQVYAYSASYPGLNSGECPSDSGDSSSDC